MYFSAIQLKQRVFCAVFACVALIFASANLSAQNKWLVLKNGQTIEGKVTLTESDDRYEVEMQNGSRIIIREGQVNFVADSIEDIYWEKWSRVDPSDAEAHTSLFRWCLKYDLLDQAQKQIDLVAKLENMEGQASHLSRMAQELDLVVTRIEKDALLAKQKEIENLRIRKLPDFPKAANSQFASAPTIPMVPIDANGRPVTKLEPMVAKSKEPAGEIGLVDFEEELDPYAQSMNKVSKRDKPAWVSNRKLDRETRLMPAGTVSFYKRHVESKLISNCIQCHDSRSAEMPLSKRSFGQTIPRRMSQQNLHFVMEQVDRTDPLSSKLLAMATTAHGTQNAASFAANDPFLFDLKKWTVAVSNDPAKWLSALNEPLTQSAPVAIPQQATAEALVAQPVEEAGQISNEIFEVDPEPIADVDPYDPSAFNRK